MLGVYTESVTAHVGKLGESFVRRLWAKDPTLWHKDPHRQQTIQHSLGWLHPSEQYRHLARIKEAANVAKGFKHVLLLGMGGSSLCPGIFRTTCKEIPGFPTLHVLDSTVPAAIDAIQRKIDLAETLYIVSSRLGATIESLSLYRYFFEKMRTLKADQACDHFMAITNPGSPLEALARTHHFRDIFYGETDIGGRYSALSNFGLLPAAMIGVDITTMLDLAEEMRKRCDVGIPLMENPGVVLGAALGILALRGRNKLTFKIAPPFCALGRWLEQLIAESTGKEGKGIVPVDGEPIGAIEAYENDRLFVCIGDPQEITDQDRQVAALQKVGHPGIHIQIPDAVHLGEMFFLWEFATAVAGHILGINPFDQPSVEESKRTTNAILDQYERFSVFPEQTPVLTVDGMCVYTNTHCPQEIFIQKTLSGILSVYSERNPKGAYWVWMAYLACDAEIDAILQKIRVSVRDRRRVATTVGYGPGLLHSTGQLHKDGPNGGLFVQITASDPLDIPIPDVPYTFGILKSSQALGDFQSLTMRKRRVIRIDLGRDIKGGLLRLAEVVRHL